MTEETYKFDTKEALAKMRWVIPVILGLAWALGIFWFLCHKFYYPAITAWLGLIYAFIYSAFVLPLWLSGRKVSYEISPEKVIKKRGDKIIRSIDISDIQSIVLHENMIILKVLDEKDFPFRYIPEKKSRQRIITILNQLGITDVKQEKINIAQLVMWTIATCIACHFLGSIIFWVVGVCLILDYRQTGIDWPMLLHAIPAFIFFAASFAAVVFAMKKKIRRSVLTLGLVIIVSVSCFIFETKNNFY